MTPEDAWGVWTLVSLKRYKKDAFLRHPLGEDAQGRIIYHPTGWMSAFLMAADWPASDGADLADSVLSYSGRWTLAGDVVRHQVDMASRRDFIGTELVRQVRFEDEGQITLYSGDPDGTHNRLRWRRTEGAPHA